MKIIVHADKEHYINKELLLIFVFVTTFFLRMMLLILRCAVLQNLLQLWNPTAPPWLIVFEVGPKDSNLQVYLEARIEN